MSTPRTRAALIPAVLAAAFLLAACTSGAGTPTTAPTGAAPGPTVSQVACAAAPEPSGIQTWTSAAENPNLVPVPVSGDLACGDNRFLFSFIDRDNKPIATPDRTVLVAFYDLAREAGVPTIQTTSRFIWGIEGVTGIYETDVTFPEAGIWGAEFATSVGGGPTTVVRMAFEVRKEGFAKRVGQAAPASKTPTAADFAGDIARVSTDQHPEPAFYQLSVDQALAQHKPFLLAFATPKFCTSGQCGPTLDRIKPFLAKYPSVSFINVEPYALEWKDGQLSAVITNKALTPVQATLDYGLTTEPWVYVVDRTGVIRASFEGVFADSELKAALDAVK